MDQNLDQTNETAMNANLHLDNIEDDIEMVASFPSEEDLEFPMLMSESVAETEEVAAENMIPDELLWQARTGLTPDTLCGAIETIIFMNDKPVSIQKIKALIDEDMPLKVIHESLQRLQAEYEEKHHGLRLLEVAEGYQYRTKATYSKYVQDIFKINSLVLSPTALEVLAILAYKQPVSKVEVDKIRGVDSGHIVRALMDKRLVRVVGRSDELGRPVLYGTTNEFLEVFNLPELSALPPEHELDEMSRVSTVGKIADIKTLVHDGDKARFKDDEIEELDMLSESIKNISAETDFTASLKVEEKKRLSSDGSEIKSAFDLLEEFVNKRLISEQNKLAFQSMLTTNIIEPKVIDDLEAGPFNTPMLDSEDEDFEMIDLDTGLPISFADGFEIEEDDGLGFDDSLIADGEYDIVVDLEFDTEDSEEEALSKALDAAFSNLTGETLESRLSDEEFTFGGALEEKSQELDELTEGMIEKGHDLDLDLSFLKDELQEKKSDPDNY
jgi:segregation and condensation protein B